ncbi:Rpn family recombination-promoting nuclease/putative transposase, partial [Treponema sp.]|uniref:Rpn family recombination-promoting nuclease/putative transposase n=1 Tax=Treponema sp. TaxID=166 RepID=UPI003FA2E515
NIIADGFRLNDAIHSEYLLQEKTAHTVLTDVLEVHFLDLQAAKKAKEKGKAAGKRSQLINWLRFIGATNRKERAMIATKSPVLQMLNEKIDVLTLSPTERKLYESRMKLKSDITTISETQFSAGVERGKSLGLAEGKSLGLAEGSRQKAFETARNLLVIGLSIDNIAKATGLTVQEVETLN